MDYTPEAMKKRFWELTDEKEALIEKLTPLRKKRDAIRDSLRGPLAEFKKTGEAVIAVERPHMAKIDTEMAMIARALGNKVGERPVKEQEMICPPAS